MNIKTITTTDGVNTVDFGSAASRFYWFRNIGTTAVHVSGKADIVAGGDGVAELAAGDSVCIETLGGKVYVLGAGKVQIHNTGDKFCPFKNAPAAGGGGNSYTKSESDAKYAQKSDIPTSLPANGGNADYAANAGNAEMLGGISASRYSTTPIKSTTFSVSTVNDEGYAWTGIAFPRYIVGVDMGHFDIIVQFCKGNHVDAGRAEWTMMFFNRLDLTTPLKGSFSGVIYYIDV